MDLVKEYALEALVVGSDQTWRAKYNRGRLFDMFLRFARDFTGKKIAYAASFGVDNWEYSKKQTAICTSLLQQFNAISVRETSGVTLCKEYLRLNAIAVLDPTLLIEREVYENLCVNIPLNKEKFLVAYVLDHR